MKIQVFCNGKINPVGIDCMDLCFSVWTEDMEVKTIELEFYKENQVKIGKFFQKKKLSGRFCYATFANFQCGEKLFYRAILTTKDGEYQSEFFFAECGLTEREIVGQWIENKNFDGRVSQFFKKFVLEEKIVSARLYIVGLGFYTSSINGKATDAYYFKPLLTDFDERHNLKDNLEYDEENFANGKKTVCYDTYDVTELLQEGENELNVLLGTGWYCNTDKDHVEPSFTYGTPKLFFELHIESEHSKTIIKSDESCQVRNTFMKSQMFEGDFMDFSKEPEPFISAQCCAPPTGKLLPALTAHDTVLERIQPLECKKAGNKLLYDFGKNHTGGLKLSVKGKCGDRLKITYYEVLLADGTPNPYTCRWTAYLNGEVPIGHLDQQGEYILSGGVDEIAPLFHWNCYRYAEVELPDGCEILSLESLFITAEMKQDGKFRCDWEVLNSLHDAFILTQRDNMHCGVPSDCPHREKLPYTGDGRLTAEATMYTFSAENFYRKWMKDIIASQGKNGWVPYTAPYMSGGGGYWWCNALTSLPLTLYEMTGDKTILTDALEPSLKLVDFYGEMHDGDYVIRRTCAEWLLGDWLAPDVIASNIAYINTLAYYSAVLEVKRAAQILSENTVVQQMEDLLKEIKTAINANFFDAEGLRYGNGVQGEDILPIVYGIVPEGYEEPLWQKIVAHYKQTGCFDTGIVLTPILLELLTVRGETDIALNIMTREEYPSFAWMLRDDTTLCEHWSKYWPKVNSAEGVEEVLEGDVSHCHPMYGSVVAWIYKHVAGLDLSEMYNGKIIFAPKFIDRVQSSAVKKKTAFGETAVEYNAYGGLKMKIKVPYGVEGELRLPAHKYEEFFATSENGAQLKSRRRGDYIYAKLSGGNWNITSRNLFGT